MSGEELAHLVGYTHQSAIANLENRATGTGGRKISEIAKTLKVPLEWLVNGPDADEVPDAPPTSTYQQHESALTPHTVQEANPLSDALMAEGLRLLSNLSIDGKRQAVTYLRFLNGGGTANPHHANRKDNSLSQSKAA